MFLGTGVAFSDSQITGSDGLLEALIYKGLRARVISAGVQVAV